MYIYKLEIQITVENAHGCVNSITKEIFVDIKSGVYIPTAFAPTNPALGVRYFQPLGYGFEECEVWIYDAWGNLVWYSNEVEDGIFVGKWDGTYNGELLKSDTYIWKMEAKFVDGKIWLGQGDNPARLKKFGSVSLIR
ncbi:MAG: hypothetical protein BWY22_02390 [Bacteroidetes bacterium ADurb.Bin217]|nr:MAG: hypothetical protein BWY22_02390 [Bacteroidetes bacterium ADurb.Bin217]